MKIQVFCQRSNLLFESFEMQQIEIPTIKPPYRARLHFLKVHSAVLFRACKLSLAMLWFLFGANYLRVIAKNQPESTRTVSKLFLFVIFCLFVCGKQRIWSWIIIAGLSFRFHKNFMLCRCIRRWICFYKKCQL